MVLKDEIRIMYVIRSSFNGELRVDKEPFDQGKYNEDKSVSVKIKRFEFLYNIFMNKGYAAFVLCFLDNYCLMFLFSCYIKSYRI